MADYLNKQIKELVILGYKKFYIYPFGKIGMQVKEILREGYGITDYVVIDNFLCNFNKEIISCSSLKGKEWNRKEIVLIASNNIEFYSDIRMELKKYVPIDNIKDIYPVHPLMRANVRVASLAAAANEIYRRNVQGSVAECGVYRGDFAQYINMVFPDRKLYLFDSFEGFDNTSVAENRDNCNQVDRWIKTLKDTSVDIVMKKMTFPDNVVVKKGFFPETAKGVSDKFCFVNLDMDLYAPTYEGLNFFWENLSGGGYIFIHDFFLWDGIEVAVSQFCKERNIGYACIPDEHSVVISKPI